MHPSHGQSATPPPGWYPDPTDPAATRLWDGTRWTENTRGGAESQPAPVQSTASPEMGWYPDPTNDLEERYWDGQRWTRNTRAPLEQPQWRSGLGSAASASEAEPAEPQPTARQWDHHTMQWRELAIVDPIKRTADGVPLGGWWRRLVGRIVDDLLIVAVVAAICFRQWGSLFASIEVWWSSNAALVNRGTADYTGLAEQIAGDQSTIWLVTLIIACMSSAYFHHRFGATPGQLLMKLRVVPLGEGKKHDGLTLLQSIRRGAALAILLAMAGIFPPVRILDGLVAAFGDRGQTTHDWLGRTQVIDARHAPALEQAPDEGREEASSR